MTANQINYLKLIEDRRSNLAREQETHRANVTAEGETARANRAREAENIRANTLNYQASIFSTEAGMRNADVNAETQRVVAGIHANASIASAAISADASRYASDTQRTINRENILHDTLVKADQLGETKRHNQVVEAETERHQKREDRSRTWGNVISVGHNIVNDASSMISSVSRLIGTMNTAARKAS